MSDTLKLAMRISAVDLFSGVLRRFRSEIGGAGAQAKAMQRDYDSMIRHASAGLKSLAVADYGYNKLKPAVQKAAELQEALLSVEGILQGAHPNAKLLADQMERVRANSIEVASHMKYSATAVTDVTRELFQGGVPLEAILEKYDSKGRLVRHGAAYMTEVLAETKHEDPATVAMNIANLGHSFQLRPDQYGEAADIIAKASVTSSGSLAQLFHNLDQVGSRAHMYGNMDLKSTAIALKALAPLGEEAGSDLGEFLSRITGGSYRGRKWMKESGFDFYDKKGHFIGLDESIRLIQKRTESMTEEQRNKMLGLLFGQTGGKAVTQLIAPSMPGVKSYWEIKDSYSQQASLEQQNDTWAKGFNAQVQKLASTNEGTLATLFDPLLGDLTSAIKKTDELSAAIGKLATEHRGVAKGVSYGSAALVGAAGLYGVYRLGRAAGPGGRLFKNLLKRGGGVAAGIAEGKAVEAATGVVPVFVTNFPAGGMTGAAGAEAATAAEKAAEKAAAKRGGARWFTYAMPALARITPVLAALSQTSAEGSDARSARELQGAAAGGDRAAAIRLAHMQLDHWWRGGSASAAEIDKRVKELMGTPESQASYRRLAAQTQVGGTIKIQIDQDGRAKVKQVKSDNPRVPLDVGMMMMLP
ncbi:phage tail tape measure protein [Frateuria sp. YIM B11624]|uniref:phage tail tape measure protein n=1 Tax=Frateuria sp. YIM B11624 TaxID=3143185 RepID=UPI003C782E5E